MTMGGGNNVAFSYSPTATSTITSTTTVAATAVTPVEKIKCVHYSSLDKYLRKSRPAYEYMQERAYSGNWEDE